MLSSKRFAIIARILDTGTSIPPVAAAGVATVGWTAVAGAPTKSLDVMDPYSPEPLKPFKKVIELF